MLVLVTAAPFWVIPAGDIIMTCVWCLCAGIIFAFTFPCYINYNVLLTHPIPSDITNGIIIALAHVYAIFSGALFTKLYEEQWYVGNGVLTGSAMVGCIASWVMGHPKEKTASSLRNQSVGEEDNEETIDKRRLMVSDD